eukprot:Seg48.2 transcript_id=Seg48.2/GoldUCD/mRNA.D3Y31 product="Craniofacial development protein 2" protein_id=Seg48.2/GoldUCD/D3Y31
MPVELPRNQVSFHFKGTLMEDNISKEMKNMNLDVLGISETRWTGSGKIKEGDFTIVYSGGEKHQYGVGCFLSKKVANSMIGFWPISERVVIVKIQAKPFDINLIQVYAPTSDHSDNEIEAFYDEIEATLKYTKSSEITMLMGDFNAKVGNMKEYPITGKIRHGVRNERAEDCGNSGKAKN